MCVCVYFALFHRACTCSAFLCIMSLLPFANTPPPPTAALSFHQCMLSNKVLRTAVQCLLRLHTLAWSDTAGKFSAQGVRVRCREAANAAQQQRGRLQPLRVLVRADTQGGAESVEELQLMVLEDALARPAQSCRARVEWEETSIDCVR